ncbi:TPM domain-containing protein [Flavobacterium channae]|uniref:TPM domain-containing protein n=1 Tax=Flavobacterium channae TaxID=2897181 RepID=UPI001E5C91B1|nr:TPM domain-containing protein [Flavobacterium channae]UGS24758.1 TPM domain-containing protein [Flavobacterium channae]
MSISRIKIFFQLLILFFGFSTKAQNIDTLTSEGKKSESIELYRQVFWDNLPKPINWTNDYENLFSDEEEALLNQIITDFEKETSVEIAVVSIDTFKVSKEKFSDLSLHMAKTWGVGKKEKSNGILILISNGYRQIIIQNGDGIVLFLSDDETAKIIRNQIIPYFKKEEYFKGTKVGLLKIMELLKTRL